jgi:undecaprenyl-diphosphatase
MLRRPDGGLEVRHAVALGLLHVPAELLPVSSSGHVALIPWLAGWSYADVDPELRKSFEVALHAGTAAALLVALRGEVGQAMIDLDRRRVEIVALSLVPPAVVTALFERAIERRAGAPSVIAAGLLLGSAAMAAVDRAPQRRGHEEAGAADALWLGVAQACALVPGVSRNAATLVAARARGFRREDANVLSRHVALPIIAAASALKGWRLARRGLPPRTGRAFAAGAAATFASTLASTWLIRQVERDRSLMPYALYRTALATMVIRRVRKNRGR